MSCAYVKYKQNLFYMIGLILKEHKTGNVLFLMHAKKAI